MDTRTGEIYDESEIQGSGITNSPTYFLPVTRDLTIQERADKQIRLYQPCGCNSGKKFKFCCHKQPS